MVQRVALVPEGTVCGAAVVEALEECRAVLSGVATDTGYAVRQLAALVSAVDALHASDDVVRELSRLGLGLPLARAVSAAVGVLDGVSCLVSDAHYDAVRRAIDALERIQGRVEQVLRATAP